MRNLCSCSISCLLGLVPLLALAGSGGINKLPPPGVLNTSGVQMLVDSRWVDANGYRPVRIEIAPLKGPAPADRQFRVVIKPQTYYGPARDSVSQIVELQQGSRSAKASIPVPQDIPWHAIVVDVFEDGQKHEDLSGDPLNWARGNYWNWNEATPCILAIDSRAPLFSKREELMAVFAGQGETAAKQIYNERLPDIRNLVRIFPDNQYSGNFVSDDLSRNNTYIAQIFNELKDTVKAEILNPAELPERWIELSSFDLIIISLEDLNGLVAQRPKVAQAMLDWLRAGQTLIVYNAHEEFAGLAQIEQLLKLQPRPNFDTTKYRGWREPVKKLRGEALKSLANNNNYPRQVYTAPGQAMTTMSGDSSGDSSADITCPFVIRPAGMGHIIAFSGDPFPGHKQDWEWMLNSLPGNSWNPTQRTGASQQDRNEDFWNFLIPGTGQAPVLSFLVFITLFVVIIGPVNYYVLHARRRLYMMLLTVPAGAFLVTMGLFVYAMFTDGLGVKSRIRSYTTIDQPAGLATSTSRQAYYASLAPSRGLMYQDDSVILPFFHEPTTRNGQRAIRRVVNWSGEEQQLKSGYLSSRSLSQLLVTKSGPTKGGLKIGTTKGNRLPVTNNFETNLEYLLVKDEDGQYFAAQNVKAGGEALLEEIDSEPAAGELARRLNHAKPAFPDGYDESLHDSSVDIFPWNRRYYGRWSNNQTTQANSLLERKLVRFGHLTTQPLEAKSYVAFAASNPLVPIGAASRQYGSLHVIEGNY